MEEATSMAMQGIEKKGWLSIVQTLAIVIGMVYMGWQIEGLSSKLGGKIDGLGGKIDGLGGKIDGLGGKIDRLNDKMTNVEIKLAEIQNDMKLAANTAAAELEKLQDKIEVLPLRIKDAMSSKQ